ncbi:MAG: hypothetical protein GYB67_17300 [Chloroflexi bacterium]|nr:hypothetical protein [Chloroflexota bacterium]
MAVRITRPGKNTLVIDTPVMPAAGVFGFGDQYRDLLKIDKLGAVVTNPVSYAARSPASGVRIVPLAAGVLVHNGLPNPGLRKVISQNRATWERLPVPLIVHVIVNNVEEVTKSIRLLDEQEAVAGLELGLSEEMSAAEVQWYVQAATEQTEKPILVRLPFGVDMEYVHAAIDAGADSLVVCAPPRGTARDRAGRLVTGRLYGPMIKPLALRMVGQLARMVNVPVIGAGGIHSPEDGRDFLEAGAVAVQVDSVVWVDPKMLEIIARDLGGLVLTQPSGALPDEWFPGMGETQRGEAGHDDTTRKRS